MIYYSDSKILIRNLEDKDAQVITEEEIVQGWDASVKKYETRLRDQREGRAIALAAEYFGDIAGYVNVYPNSIWGAFAGKGLPEIVDFSVLEKYRCRGIGSKLMDVAEKIASGYAEEVYLGVGLHSGYGCAQRMYVKRGYIPDGGGVWYGSRVCPQYADCCNDDNLVLYMSKRLS